MKFLVIFSVLCLVQLSRQSPYGNGGGWGKPGNWGDAHKGHGHGPHDDCHHATVTEETKVVEEKGGHEVVVTGEDKSGTNMEVEGHGNHGDHGHHGHGMGHGGHGDHGGHGGRPGKGFGGEHGTGSWGQQGHGGGRGLVVGGPGKSGGLKPPGNGGSGMDVAHQGAY